MNEGRGEGQLYRDVGEIKGGLNIVLDLLQGPNGLAASFRAHVEKTDERLSDHGERLTKLESKESLSGLERAKRWALILLIYSGVITFTVTMLVWLIQHRWPATP